MCIFNMARLLPIPYKIVSRGLISFLCSTPLLATFEVAALSPQPTQIRHDEDECVLSAAPSKDSLYIVTTTDKEIIRIWRLEPDQQGLIQVRQFHFSELISTNGYQLVRARFDQDNNEVLHITVIGGIHGAFILIVGLTDLQSRRGGYTDRYRHILLSAQRTYGMSYHSFPNYPAAQLALYRQRANGSYLAPQPILYCNDLDLMSFNANESLFAGACNKTLYICSVEGDEPCTKEFESVISSVEFIPDNNNSRILVAAGNTVYIVNANSLDFYIQEE